MHSYKVALQCCRASTAIFKSHLYVGLHCVSKKQHHIFRCNLTNDFDKLQKQGLGCVLGLMRERSLTPAVGQVGIKPDNFPPMVCSLFRDARMNLKLGGGAEYVLLHNAKNARILFYCLYLNNIILNVKTISILFYIWDVQTLF